MSEQNSKIITGLRLSEAIKYLEEHEKALIKRDQSPIHCFSSLENWAMDVKSTYSVKLPPPKSVTITKQMISDAWGNYVYGINGEVLDFEAFCKELGL